MITELPKNEFEALYRSIRNLISTGIENRKTSEELKSQLHFFLKERNTAIDVCEEKNKDSLLHYAAARGNTKVIELLIKAGLDVNSQNRFNRTPLYYACISEKKNAVDLLLAEQADLNLGNPGDTPFLAVIRDDNLIEPEYVNANIVKMLIQRGAEINQPSNDGFSPLQLAVIHRKTLIIQEIINTGRANLQFTDIDGNTALHMVAKYRDKNTESANLQKEKNIAEFLIQHIDAINLQNKNGDTPLHLAIMNGNTYVVELLLEKDYLFPQMGLLKIKNNIGLTAIHTALQEASKGGNRLAILKLLMRVATQDDLNSVNNAGETAIQMVNKLIKDAELIHDVKLLHYATEMLELTAKRLGLTARRLIDEDNNEIVANIAILSENALALSNFAEHLSDRLEEFSDKVETLTPDIRELSEQVEALASNAKELSNCASKTLDSGSLSDHIIELSSDAKKLLDRAKELSEQGKQLLDNEELRKRALHYHTSVLRESPDHTKQLLDNKQLKPTLDQYTTALREIKHIIEQSDYLSWKNEQSTLPTSFPDDQEIYNYDYGKIEADCKSLAATYINGGKASEYERNNKALLNNSSGYKEKLFAHLALAGLYGELKKQNPLPTGVSFDDLRIHESYHYSEAFKLTQGPIDYDAHVVLQREIGVAKHANLGTYNVQQCVVAVAYDPITGKVVLSHFDRYSGPLTFIKQIVAEFDSSHKIDIYLSGGRDRSTGYYDAQGKYVVLDGKKVSDSNIDQVLKQIYFYKERFNLKSFDLGDKPSPEGIVFDQHSASLVHRTPDRSDTSLHSRIVKMSGQMIKDNYLRPLDKIDFSKSEASRQINFSPEEKQKILEMHNDYTNNLVGTEMWRHNQLLYPFLVIKERREPTIFDQALLKNNHDAFDMHQLQNEINAIDLSARQNQETINTDLTVLREQIDPNSNQPMQIDSNSDHPMQVDSDTNFYDEPPSKRRCMRERKKRNIEAMLCVDSRDEEDMTQEEQRIRESFDTVQISKNIKNIEFYNQLLKVSEQVSQDEAVDPNAEEALIAAINDINLDSIDPEINDLARELKINSENKETIKNILSRSGVAETIGKVAEGAGFSYTVFLVGKHLVNGNIEGLGYDALNLWILPKMGEKISNQVLKWGEEYSSTVLKGFAPVLGRSIGNFGAFLGLGEAIKARMNAKDPIDIKIADLNIATNSIFIAVDIPGMITGIRSVGALGETAEVLGEATGVLGEFAGPAGGVISLAVIVMSDFIQSEFELEKLEEQISLIGEEEHEFYWDFFLGKKLPAYIERDIKAKNIYAQYIKKRIKDFEAYDVIVMTLPPILITKETRISACLKLCTSLSPTGAFCSQYEYKWSSKEEITKIEFDTNIRTKITNLWLNCFDFMFERSKIILSTKRPSCLDNRIIPQHLYSNDIIYDITCGPVVNDISATILSIHDDMSLPGEEQKCDHRRTDKTRLSQTEERWFFNRYVPDCNNSVVYMRNYFREPHRRIYYITSSSTEFTIPNSTDIIFHGKRIVTIDSAIKNYDTVNRYHFSNLLEDCAIFQGNTTNFFYITGNQFSCYLGGMSYEQKNIVVIQGNFTDSENIHSIVGNNETNYIEVSHANYVDGNGGNDIITVKPTSTTIKAYFGDFIDGNGLVLLPMNVTDIVKMTYANNRTVIYSEKAEPISIAQQTLIKTADNFFITPSRIDNQTVTNVQLIKNVGHIVLHEPLIGLYDDAYFLDPMLTNLHEINNPNFGITKQLNSNNYHIIIGDRGHHIFYTDKESCSFYWEALEDISHLYIFDKNSGDITISKANGLLDFIKLNRSSLHPTMNAEGEVKINTGNLQITLLKNYKNVTVTLDGKEYYNLQNAKLTRDYCSHDLKIDGKFSVNASDLLNHYNCFSFDSEKVVFLKSNENLLLLSNKRALFILAYYSLAHEHGDLSIQLNNHIIKPEAFRKKANNPSFFRHYLVSEKGLQIYHNQPVHNQKMGLVDLKDKSVLDCDMKVIKGNLLLFYKNNRLVEVANWDTYPPAREMAFIFSDAIVNAKCILSTCPVKNIIEEFQQEKIKIKNKFLPKRREKRHQPIETLRDEDDAYDYTDHMADQFLSKYDHYSRHGMFNRIHSASNHPSKKRVTQNKEQQRLNAQLHRNVKSEGCRHKSSHLGQHKLSAIKQVGEQTLLKDRIDRNNEPYGNHGYPSPKVQTLKPKQQGQIYQQEGTHTLLKDRIHRNNEQCVNHGYHSPKVQTLKPKHQRQIYQQEATHSKNIDTHQVKMIANPAMNQKQQGHEQQKKQPFQGSRSKLSPRVDRPRDPLSTLCLGDFMVRTIFTGVKYPQSSVLYPKTTKAIKQKHKDHYTRKGNEKKIPELQKKIFFTK